MPSLPRVFLATSARRTINTSDVLTAKIFRNRRSSAKKYAFERRNRSSSVTTAGRTGVDVQAGERKVLKQEIPNDENRERRQRRIHYATAAAATIGTSAAIFSIATRKWRDDRIATLTPAAASGAFYYPSGKSRSSSPSWKNASLPSSLEESSSKRLINSQQHNTIIDNNSRGWPCKRNLKTLLETVERAGLMGKKPSVKDELDSIRKWHVDHGYRGGLVIRELNVPLFEGSMLFPYNWGNNDIDEDGDNEEERSDGDRNENEKSIVDGVKDILSQKKQNQRQCYYLYYEVRGDGEVRQQIFCRGTTVRADIYTMLKSLSSYDSELGCKVHAGFRRHADRLLTDVQPLLVSPLDKSSTVEVCGHSLGGAVALLVAMKLRKRGYNVIRVTTIGAPKICDADAVPTLSTFLPPDTLRLENDVDCVPYMPPYYHSAYLGSRLWFVTGGVDGRTESIKGDAFDDGQGEKHIGSSAKDQRVSARFVSANDAVKNDLWWVNSFLLNWRTIDVWTNWPSSHLIPMYTSKIKDLISEMRDDTTKNSANSTTSVGRDEAVASKK